MSQRKHWTELTLTNPESTWPKSGLGHGFGNALSNLNSGYLVTGSPGENSLIRPRGLQRYGYEGSLGQAVDKSVRVSWE